MTAIRAIDLCCGGGGWACAARGTKVKIVRAYDFWDAACETYRLNHPGTAVVCADLLDAAVQKEIRSMRGKVDLVLGGIPCEWISLYRNVGHAKTRPDAAEILREQALLDAVLALVRYLNPRWWCLEDVQGLARHLPPLTPWRFLEAADYSAQRRKRIYVGEFPRPAGAGCREVLRDRLRPGPYRIGRRTHGRTGAKNCTFKADKFYAATLDDKAPTVCAISSRRDAEMAVVDATLAGGKRQMEWQEAAALQGFPPDYVFYGSPTDVSRMVGRAIQIDTGRAILQAISREARTT